MVWKFMRTLVLASVFFFGVAAPAQGTWSVRGGVTSIFFNPDLSRDLGLIIVRGVSAKAMRDESAGYASFAEHETWFDAPLNNYEGLGDGRLRHRGGPVIHRGKDILDLSRFVITPGQFPYDLELQDEAGNVWFRMSHAHPHLFKEEGKLFLMNMDLVMTEVFASWWGDLRLEGSALGGVDVELFVNPPADSGEERGFCTPNFAGDVDVELVRIDGISQSARLSGQVALSANAHLENVGTADVIWFRAIAPDDRLNSHPPGQHPYLCQSYYRITDGAIQQLGRSDVKHAFYAVNSGCPCQGDQILYVGCGDLYSSFNNADQTYLAPRDEVTAHSGAWESNGSHFDAEPVDNFRDHCDILSSCAGEHSVLEHRLTVNESDLAQPGATYFIELWYMAQDDINIYNGMRYLEHTPSWNGSVWTFPAANTDGLAGPAIRAWVDPADLNPGESSTAINTGEGNLELAVKVTEAGEGSHFEYALMNLDFDRQINRFTVPINEEVIITNAASAWPSVSTTDDWQVEITASEIVFSAPDGMGLDWGALVNFSFDANVGSESSQVGLGVREAGDPLSMQVNGLIPDCTTTAEYTGCLTAWLETCSVLDLVSASNSRCPVVE